MGVRARVRSYKLYSCLLLLSFCSSSLGVIKAVWNPSIGRRTIDVCSQAQLMLKGRFSSDNYVCSLLLTTNVPMELHIYLDAFLCVGVSFFEEHWKNAPQRALLYSVDIRLLYDGIKIEDVKNVELQYHMPTNNNILDAKRIDSSNSSLFQTCIRRSAFGNHF